MLRVAAAQPKTLLNDVGANVAAHADAVRRAKSQLVVFPEMSLTGYAFDAPVVNPSSHLLLPLIDACREVGTTALAGAPVSLNDRTGIGVVEVDADGARVVYAKMSLGGPEPEHFVAGAEPAAITVSGWRVGIGVCKDTRIGKHLQATFALGIDLYVAGLAHAPTDLHEFEERARHIADSFGVPVVFAGFAGPTGAGFATTSGGSGIWDATGAVICQAGTEPDQVVAAVLT
jgi:predicted amidohydrolase